MNAFRTASSHPVSHMVFNPSGESCAIVQGNYGVTVCDRARQSITAIPVPRVAAFSGVVFFDNGTKLALGSRRGVHVFDAASGTLLHWFHGWYLVLPLLGAWESTIIYATRMRVQKLNLGLDTREHWRSPQVKSLSGQTVAALSPDGRLAVSISGVRRARLSLVEPETGAVLGSLPHGVEGSTFTFAADSSRLAVCDGQNVSVYDVDPGAAEFDDDPDAVPRPNPVEVAPKPHSVLQPILKLERPTSVHPADRWQPPVGLSADGHRLLIRRPRNRVQLWDIATASHIGEWGWRLPSVTCLAIAPDGLTAAAGCRFGNVVLWDLE